MSSVDPLHTYKSLTVWDIAGGVFIGSLAAYLVVIFSTWAFASIQMELLSAQLRREIETTQAELQQQARNQAEARRQELERQRMLTKAQEDARRDALEEQRRKEDAWRAFYHRDPACDDNPTTEMFTRCANEHLRAKTQFESAYRRARP